MADAERKILSTRVLEPAIISAAGRKGILIDCISFIDIHYKSIAGISQQLGNIDTGDIFLFTSQHAVQAAFEILKNLKNKTYCISGATFHAVKQTSLDVIATAAYAGDLIRLIAVNEKARYVLFCGDKRLPTIPHFLQQLQLKSSEVICYENRASSKKVEQQYDGIMFYSPSGVESYFELNSAAPHQKYYCIGTTTAQAILKYSKENIIIAEKPEIRAMLEKINGS
ncbi:uroporphyrinogen-III synthase [Niabella aquatica]